VSRLLCLSHAYSCHKLYDVAQGLHYLHFRSIVHGDLGVRGRSKSRFTTLTPGQPNIVVDGSGRARIAGFRLAAGPAMVALGVTCRGHTGRWTAPEVLGEGPYDKEADIFSFAMVVIEVCRRRFTMYRPYLLSFRIDAGIHWRDSVQ